MPMPMVPGLLGGADFPGEEAPAEAPPADGGSPVEALAALLNSADPADLSAIVTEVNASLEAGELDELLGTTTPAAPPPPESDGEESEDGEESGSESAGEVDARTTATMVASMVGEIAQIDHELTELAAAAAASESDFDPEEALAKVAEAVAEAEEAQSEADAAIADEDLDAAASAREKAEKALSKAQDAISAVKKDADGAAKKLEEENEPDPLLLWAQQHR